MARNRKRDMADYNSLYSTAPSERSEMGWPLCVYCGSPAETVDHVPPVSRIHDYRALRTNESYLRLKCCEPCNTMLGDSLQGDVLERIDVAKRLLRKKLGRKDVGYLWTEEDLNGLGKNLRSAVGASMRKAQILIGRIEYRGGLRAILGMLADKAP